MAVEIHENRRITLGACPVIDPRAGDQMLAKYVLAPDVVPGCRHAARPLESNRPEERPLGRQIGRDDDVAETASVADENVAAN